MALDQLKLNINKVTSFYGKTPIIRQGDANETLPILLGNGYLTNDLTKVDDIRFYAEKSGNKIVDMLKSADPDAFPVASAHGYLEIILPPQLYTSHGDIDVAYVQFITGDVKESTSTFQFRVLPSKGSADDNDNYIPEAANIVDDIKSKDDAAQTVLEHVRDKGTEADTIVAGAQGKIDGAVKQATDAADTANTAASNADNARDDFNQVKADTLAAKDAANAAAGKANDSAAKADTATAKADTATAKADTATAKADTAAAAAGAATAAAGAATDKANASSAKADTSAANADTAAKAANDFIAAAPSNPAFKGPKGDAGTGIQLKGSADSTDKLPTTGNTVGDTYLVAGHLYIWENDAWTDAGELQGPAGKTPYLHTAWSWSSDGKDRFTTAYPGENLLLGTSSTNEKTVTGTGWASGSSASNANYIPVSEGEKYTYSAVITNVTFASFLEIAFYDSNKNRLYTVSNYDKGGISVPGAYYVTATVTANISFMVVHVVLNNPSTTQSVSFIKEKIVRGDYDGIYTPNPSEDPENAYPVYRGEYADYTATASTDPTKYTWAKVKGETGPTGKSAYQVWLSAGNTGTEADYLASLIGLPGKDGKDGKDGKSAYQEWLDAGNTGTQADFLASLKGADGKDGTTPDLTPYLKSADAANTYLKSSDAASTYQTPTQVQARVDAKIVSVADEATATSNSATYTTVLYVWPEV